MIVGNWVIKTMMSDSGLSFWGKQKRWWLFDCLLLVVKPKQTLEYAHSTCVLVFSFPQQFLKFPDTCISNMNSIAKLLNSFFSCGISYQTPGFFIYRKNIDDSLVEKSACLKIFPKDLCCSLATVELQLQLVLALILPLVCIYSSIWIFRGKKRQTLYLCSVYYGFPT